jgi:DNA modification methylase
MFSNHVTVMGKPLLWFYKGDILTDFGTHVPDFIQSEPQDKTLHEWAQSQVEATHFIERLTSLNEIVLDPFMGSATTGIASLKLNRQFIGIEIDSARIETARYNLLTYQLTS